MNALYNNARYRLLIGDLLWLVQTFKLIAIPVESPYTFDASHLTVSGAGFTVGGVSQALGSKLANASGYAQANPALFDPTPGLDVGQLVLAQDNGGPQANWPLILYIDEGANLPFDTNGVSFEAHPDWASDRGWFRA